MTRREAAAETPIARLVALLDVTRQEGDLFLGSPGRGSGRLFGGLVAAQSVVAAGRTVRAGSLHSLHGYFLRPGGHDEPIHFAVDRIRDGRTFTTRRVVAHQGGEAIFNLAASFARPEDGISHQDPMPDAPDPEGLEDWEDLRVRALGEAARHPGEQPVEVRVCDPDSLEPGVAQAPRRNVWLRARGELPDDRLLHEALLVYASDRTLVGTAARPHGLSWGQRMGASLDHAVWIHRPARFDDWILYATESPAAHAARGLVFGAMYTRGGERLATVAQEALIRVRQPGS